MEVLENWGVQSGCITKLYALPQNFSKPIEILQVEWVWTQPGSYSDVAFTHVERMGGNSEEIIGVDRRSSHQPI